ncbi:hypothetical protein [Streptomyces sp. NBC_01304]|uniref:hypothetical protein n=1 Tax=Streptomyces sp. NBC_01304 TaxID=2903818 RepID=UPI002E0D5645|nr:hypothetical protein OG430_05395 [Streptomyces sp. NBC_01304]
MEWGTVPAWAAVGASALALVISCLALLQSKRSADASTRSAQTAADALEFHRRAAQPRVALAISRLGSGTYRLTNGGTAPALAPALAADDVALVRWREPVGDVLHPGDSRVFTLNGSRPSRLRFSWEGHEEVVHVPVPPPG